MPPISKNEPVFHVVQFIELPFEGIADYVCVPRTWVKDKATNDKATVAYPRDEDPSETRDRVKRKEKRNDKWRFYMATVKYDTVYFCDAESWIHHNITTRNNYGTFSEEKSKVTDTQPKLPENKKSRSANQNHKRPAKSESRKKIDEKRLKLDESAQSSSAVVNDSKVEPRSQKRKQSDITQNYQPMECFQAESSVASNEIKTSNDLAAVDPNLQSVNYAAAASISYRQSDGHQNLVAHEQYYTRSHQYLAPNQDNFQQKLLQDFTKSNSYDHLPTSETDYMRVPSIVQHTTHLLNATYQTPELAQQRHPNYQPSRIQHTTVQENGYQNLCTQEQMVDQSTQTSKSPVTRSHLNIMDKACQTDECMVKETLTPYQAVNSDAKTVTNHEVIAGHVMSTDEAPETTNNVHGTANDPGHGSADRQTDVQNSTSTNHQPHSRIVLEQQMLDHFATLFTQMGSTLRHTTEMNDALRSSILDSAELYKKVLGAVEEFNTARKPASNASPSSNLRPEIPRSSEKRRTKLTASTSSIHQDEKSNDIANKTPKKQNKLFRLVLPPEYDAYNTRWTLKNGKKLPGLVELMPQSGVYVSCDDLKYCQQVSKDCKSLAKRLLPLVFNRNALSTCTSMSEKAQASTIVGCNIRPDLDDHACSVLLDFVTEHGRERGWNTDRAHILSILDSQIQEIRFKYGVMVEYHGEW